tara:strand:+ start:1784 stop:3070 length:1287 start_codon:yes stop_codon:yes gene_type:complete
VQDVFRRTLEVAGIKTHHVRNITDVDDKTIRQSQAEGVTLKDFTDKWTQKFHEDCAQLNMLPPHEEPSAVQHIPQQIELIEQLIECGHAYTAEDGSVYYKVSSFKNYGKLAHLDPQALKTQSTSSSGATNLADEYERESINDFALWKAKKPEDGPNAWPSPWGEGRPGWHIECSAMARHYLGDTLDLHAGGIDLIFPHHENEIAQTEAVTQKPLAHHWLHSAHLQVEGQKMSKSLGNLYTLEDLKTQGHSPAAVRYLLISGHYRQPLNFTADGLKAANSALQKLEKLIKSLLEQANKYPSDWASYVKPDIKAWGIFQSAWDSLCNDLNIPSALGHIFSSSREIGQTTEEKSHTLLQALGGLIYALGLPLFETPEKVAIPDSIQKLAAARWQAKQNKDFKASDEFRDELLKHGWQVLDQKEGYTLEKKP